MVGRDRENRGVTGGTGSLAFEALEMQVDCVLKGRYGLDSMNTDARQEGIRNRRFPAVCYGAHNFHRHHCSGIEDSKQTWKFLPLF